jgi:uncharacterized membrane protein YfcA
MMSFNVVGGVIGTAFALKHGSKMVRVFFIWVVLALILKTANDSYHIIDFIR